MSIDGNSYNCCNPALETACPCGTKGRQFQIKGRAHGCLDDWMRVAYQGYIFIQYMYNIGGFNPSEKYESQLGLLFQIYGKIKHV